MIFFLQEYKSVFRCGSSSSDDSQEENKLCSIPSCLRKRKIQTSHIPYKIKRLENPPSSAAFNAMSHNAQKYQDILYPLRETSEENVIQVPVSIPVKNDMDSPSSSTTSSGRVKKRVKFNFDNEENNEMGAGTDFTYNDYQRSGYQFPIYRNGYTRSLTIRERITNFFSNLF